MIHFDPEAHAYSVDGVARVSVTQIIEGAGLIDNTWFTEESRTRGKAVHLATAFHDEGDLDVDSVAEAYQSYLRAWIRFKEEARFTPELIEHRVFHERYGYCGTLDRTGYVEGSAVPILADIKTGIAAPWHPLQLCGYSHALDGNDPNKFRRMTVLLRADGTFKVIEYSAAQYRDHWNTFLCCYGLWSFRNDGGKNVRNSNAA